MPKRIMTGTVTSDKTNKTVTVKVERKVKHPLYGKIIRRSKKYHAHDETNEYVIGDTVRIEETKPISKTKTWTVIDRVQASKGVAVAADLDVAEATPTGAPAEAQAAAKAKAEAGAKAKAEKEAEAADAE
ncbi:30S ribosomal protein S17 [Alteripontixanthobacter maritimus]|uniref:Small ribosomal subunit protein uS17 n=1 Tax=Alteripontixanthobacter maritimus TaxID=2161824 RepID=A0A369QDB5_9SPHN|nr:30S ribosomal protein S17 [Alteripontixanthobacter maritimus]